MSFLQIETISHARKVCSLYKRAVRNLESYYVSRDCFRAQAVMMRARFDQYRDIKDMKQAKLLLKTGEEELAKSLHYQPLKKFPNSPGGIAYGREVHIPDWVLDYWHPLEKAQYPEYFARREQRKKEYIEMWEKEYGKPEKGGDYH